MQDTEQLQQYFADNMWKTNWEKKTHFFAIDTITATIFPHKFKADVWRYVINDVFSNRNCRYVREAKLYVFDELYANEVTKKKIDMRYESETRPSDYQEKELMVSKATEDIKLILSYISTLDSDSNWRSIEKDGLYLPLAPRELIQKYIEKILFQYPIKHRDIILSQLVKPAGIPNIIRACHIK